MAPPSQIAARRSSKVTAEMKAALKGCETVIIRGYETFIEVGLALTEIDRGHLYLAAGCRTFADYYRDKWGYDKSYISRLIAGAAIGQAIRVKMPELRLLESHVRELAPLVKWQDGKVTDCAPAVKLLHRITVGGIPLPTAKKLKAAVARKIGRPHDSGPKLNLAPPPFLRGEVVGNAPEARQLLKFVREQLRLCGEQLRSCAKKPLDGTDIPDLGEKRHFVDIQDLRALQQMVLTADAKLELVEDWLEKSGKSGEVAKSPPA